MTSDPAPEMVRSVTQRRAGWLPWLTFLLAVVAVLIVGESSSLQGRMVQASARAISVSILYLTLFTLAGRLGEWRVTRWRAHTHVRVLQLWSFATMVLITAGILFEIQYYPEAVPPSSEPVGGAWAQVAIVLMSIVGTSLLLVMYRLVGYAVRNPRDGDGDFWPTIRRWGVRYPGLATFLVMAVPVVATIRTAFLPQINRDAGVAFVAGMLIPLLFVPPLEWLARDARGTS